MAKIGQKWSKMTKMTEKSQIFGKNDIFSSGRKKYCVALCGIVWWLCGVVWRCVMLCGVVWSCVVLCGVVWCCAPGIYTLNCTKITNWVVMNVKYRGGRDKMSPLDLFCEGHRTTRLLPKRAYGGSN